MPVIQFKGKTAVEAYHHIVPHHTLKFNPKLSVLPKGEKPRLDGNLLIEGDNLIALKALLPTHAGRIKCVYIDPPYNTGNERWVYNDNLTQPQFKEWIGETVGREGEDLTRHDKWCCMMYPRLQLLRELLRDDGAIFVSIDDNEVAHLRMLMDEVFGAPNFVANIVWEKKYSRTNDADYLSDNHDHILLYAKHKATWKPLGLERTADQLKAYRNPDNHPLGPWQDVVYTCNKTKDERPNLFYPIRNPFTGKDVWPLPNRVWGCGPETTAINQKENRLWWGENGEKSKPRLKLFLSEVEAGIVANTIWKREEVGDTQEAERILREIVPEHKFLGVKPPRLIKRIIKLSTEPGDIILDSFAGSGTTAQAVLEVNREDNGDRSFICVQQPFETKQQEVERFNICRQITYERAARVIRGYKYSGVTEEVLFEKKVNLTLLKAADEILDQISLVKRTRAAEFDSITTDITGATLRVLGLKTYKAKKPGIGGSFSYIGIGLRLFGEYRNLGGALPSVEELAKYIFYTETSRDFDKKLFNPKTGKLGEKGKTSYYLLYTPNDKQDKQLDLNWLKSVEKSEQNKNLVVYCEKIWIHRDDLAKYERESGRKVRPMIIPFNLK